MQTDRRFFYLFISFFLLSSTVGFAAEVSVYAQVDGKSIYDNQPVRGIVSITHPQESKVDLATVMIGDEPLAIELGKKELLADRKTALSIFNFELPPRSAGAHSLPPITIMIDGNRYKSIPTTYQVLPSSQRPTAGKGSSPDLLEKQAISVKPFFRLEPFVQGKTSLYPGETTLVGYNYFFNVSVEITVEEVPLLEAEGLVKVGEKVVKEGQADGVNIVQIAQKVRAVKPGTFEYGPSYVEGRSYIVTRQGERVYSPEMLSSTSEAVAITVSPFPERDRPPSFNGALGDFSWQAKLLSSGQLRVGQEVKLQIEARGSGDLEQLSLPSLCCEPGLGGFFRLSDLPAIGTVEGETKKFIVTMRPLTDAITEIPSLQFSSYDPEGKQYVVSYSEPIKLTVLPESTVSKSSVMQKGATVAPIQETNGQESPPVGWNSVEAIRIEGNYPLASGDLTDMPFGTWWVLFIIPFGIGAMIFQLNLFHYLQTIEKSSSLRSSAQLLKKALRAPLDSAEQHQQLTAAFLLKLVECGEIETADLSPEQLAAGGRQGMVRELLLELEEQRYTAGARADSNAKELLHRALQLFETLGGSS